MGYLEWKGGLRGMVAQDEGIRYLQNFVWKSSNISYFQHPNYRGELNVNFPAYLLSFEQNW
jgi:hypothetical protein